MDEGLHPLGIKKYPSKMVTNSKPQVCQLKKGRCSYVPFIKCFIEQHNRTGIAAAGILNRLWNYWCISPFCCKHLIQWHRNGSRKVTGPGARSRSLNHTTHKCSMLWFQEILCCALLQPKVINQEKSGLCKLNNSIQHHCLIARSRLTFFALCFYWH